MGSLHDKVVLLIEGESTFGQSLAVSLAERGADIAIVVCLGDQPPQRIFETRRKVGEKGRRCLIIPTEGVSSTIAKKVVDKIVGELGRLDIFVDYSALSEISTGGKDVSGSNVTAYSIKHYRWSNAFSNFELMAAALRHIVERDQTAANDRTSMEARRIPMRVAQELINKPIISIKEGEELGRFQDIYLDKGLESVMAIYLGKDGLLTRKENLIKWENVITMGTDALLVDEADALLDLDRVSEIEDYIKRDDLIGRPIDTPGGTKIGRIGDVVIDQDATVAGFSLAQTYVSGPIAANRAISRSAVVDTGNDDGVMTAELSEAEDANLKVVFEGLFADPSVAAPAEDTNPTRAEA